MIRVFVVDDSAFARKATAKVLAAEAGVRVVGEAASGAEALALIPRVRPDLVTLDLDMPGMNGLAVLKRLRQGDPALPVVMLSAHTREGAEATIEALAAGAADFVDKSRFGLMDLDGFGRELREKVKVLARPGRRPDGQTVGRSPGRPAGRAGAAEGRDTPETPAGWPSDRLTVDLCVIGASTGGPAALQQLLEGLPGDFPLPIAIVQHMPPGFTLPFATRLNAHCRLRVGEAGDGERLAPGRVVIAPAGIHLRVTDSLSVVLSREPAHARHVPSVDVLMHSAARARPGRVLGVLLTGMGDDGADGMAAIRTGGGVTIAESEETCVVYGMPRAAVQRAAAAHVLPLPAIGRWLASLRAESPGAV
ncbi:MAG TPA: chemotaxis-specific protein-glutamate methyltransferase CheB [Gemmatimonadales bacterium]|nr:chemotaxis-specific protein-glutamate methyltransferase CheB [Gemmatimonadales bacterium]